MNIRNRPADAPEVVARFYTYVEVSTTLFWAGTPCHMWTGGKSRGGERFSEQAFYGTFNPGGTVKGGVRAHVYIAWVHGLIPSLKLPEDHNLDHRCNRALCCNPFHLELVTALVNQQRRIDRARAVRRAIALNAPLPGWKLMLYVPAGEDAPCPF